MSSAVVFVFLLDNLPGLHNSLNESVHASLPSPTNGTFIHSCNNTIADEIFAALSKQLGLNIIPGWRTNGPRPNDIFRRMSPQSENIGNFDNTVEFDNSKDGSLERDTDINNDERKVDNSDCSEDFVSGDDEISVNGTKVQFPKSAPFLVAIFETLSNVTAQTCAGSLVSPRWVLTASSCVNLLATLYGKNTNSTSSHYTIVAGSTNPLSEGTVHNVTKVLVHPDPTVDHTHRTQGQRRAKGPFLALMRIEPEIVGETIEMGGKVKDSEVMVYGWILSKNESGTDALNITSMSATVLTTAECKAMYSYRNHDVLCLFNNDLDKNIMLLSTGGPVLAVQGNNLKMLAVAQTDDHVFVAYSLAAHLKWIKKILSDKDL